MAKRTVVTGRIRVSDQISLGVLGKTVTLERVNQVLTAQGKHSQRVRDLPAHVMVYYVIAMALYMEEAYQEILWRLVEGITWLMSPEERVQVASKGAISRARVRVGWEVLRQL